jgi:hypothetical protein
LVTISRGRRRLLVRAHGVVPGKRTTRAVLADDASVNGRLRVEAVGGTSRDLRGDLVAPAGSSHDDQQRAGEARACRRPWKVMAMALLL